MGRSIGQNAASIISSTRNAVIIRLDQETKNSVLVNITILRSTSPRTTSKVNRARVWLVLTLMVELKCTACSLNNPPFRCYSQYIENPSSTWLTQSI